MHRVTLLIAEDESNYAELLRRRLESLGTTIKTATTLEEARKKMQEDPKPDLVFLDLRFPDSPDSLQTLAAVPELKQLNPEAPVVILTGDPDEQLPKIAETVGAEAFRRKDDLAAQKDLYVAMKDALDAQKKKGNHHSENGVKLINKVMEFLGGVKTASVIL